MPLENKNLSVPTEYSTSININGNMNKKYERVFAKTKMFSTNTAHHGKSIGVRIISQYILFFIGYL